MVYLAVTMTTLICFLVETCFVGLVELLDLLLCFSCFAFLGRPWLEVVTFFFLVGLLVQSEFGVYLVLIILLISLVVVFLIRVSY